jgi:hypothetical protein
MFSRQFAAQRVTVKMMDGTMVHGKVNLAQGGKIFSRVSDIFTKFPEPFIVVSDATMGEQKGLVLVLNKSSIMWVVPEDKYPQEVG